MVKWNGARDRLIRRILLVDICVASGGFLEEDQEAARAAACRGLLGVSPTV